MNVYRFESLKRDDVYYDYQNIYTFEAVVPIRDMFVSTARLLLEKGETEKAENLLDKCYDIMPDRNFPYNISWMRSLNEVSLVRMVDAYYNCGARDKALDLAQKFGESIIKGIVYFSNTGGEVINQKCVDDQVSIFYYLIDILEKNDDKDIAEFLQKKLYVDMQGE